PGAPWKAPARAGAPLDADEAARAARGSAVPASAAGRMDRLALTDVVDLALGNNPQTRVSWSQARSAAATYASARGRFVPTIDGSVTGGPVRSVSQNPARVPSDRTTMTAALQLNYILFDFGARGGAMAAAHEALFAADFTHNATVQNVALQAEVAYFNYQAARGLLEASDATVATATANLSAAERRHDVGLATIADVLQARTALAQARLGEQSAQGGVQAARATLAVACGIAANAPFDVAPDSGAVVTPALTANVDSIIESAVRNRPDVAAARALARQSAQQVRAARSAALPALTLGANRGQVYANSDVLEGQTYSVTFGLSVPLFSGLSRESDIAAAQENAAAAAARAEQARITAIAQVFASYYALQTAAQRVVTSADLLASAAQSEEVARGRYAEGVGSILDLLAAQNALADARAQRVQARWTWQAALAQLAHDAGTLGPRGEPNLSTSGNP
ncbi:MAG TPA: TolC family protein, partial [Gemmatimonadaceae bacterium]|nr:TolC family protein [Gemmatimonadaceae bacterium]